MTTAAKPVPVTLKQPRTQKSSRLNVSSFLAAFTSFLVLNALLLNLKSIQFDPFKYPQTNWMWWLVNDLRNSPEKFGIATMGSSLVMSAMCNCDSSYLGKDLDLTRYHESAFFNSRVCANFGGSCKTIDLSTCGQMPSDSYLLTKLLLQLNQHPNLIVYGVAPRDFLDCNLANERDTQNFKYLSRLVPSDQLLAQVDQAPLDRIDTWCQKNCFFYKYALDLQMILKAAETHLVNACVPQPSTTRTFSADERQKLLPSYEINKVVSGALYVRKGSWKPSSKWVRDNSPYYVQAFRQPNPRTSTVQFHCLGKLSNLCKDEQIQLVLVNMPLSGSNMALLGAPRYKDYLSQLRNFTDQNKLPLYDLNDTTVYKDCFFEDSVHLNDFGGKYFVESLLHHFAQDPSVRAAVVAAGAEAGNAKSLALSNRSRTH